MGQICGLESHEPYEISQKESDLFRELKLTKQEIDKLLKSFQDIDIDNSKKIRMDEFFGACRIEATNCNQKIFGIFDSDSSGTLVFSEFVCAMWMFLTLDQSDLASFLYSLFDTDRSGALDVSEIKNIISLVHHKLLNTRSSIQRLLDELSKKNHKLTAEEFSSWTKSNPSLLEPVFHLHLELRNHLLGNHFWQTLQTRRYSNGNQTNPRYIDKLQKQLDAIAKEESSKKDIPKGKKIHPKVETNKQNTKDEHSTRKKVEKSVKTEEKNNTIIDDTNNNNNPVIRKKSDVEQVSRKKSDVEQVTHKKSDVEKINPFDEPSEKKHHHSHSHHHHSHSHHSHHHSNGTHENDGSSSSSHHPHRHHSGHNHSSNSEPHSPKPIRI